MSSLFLTAASIITFLLVHSHAFIPHPLPWKSLTRNHASSNLIFQRKARLSSLSAQPFDIQQDITISPVDEKSINAAAHLMLDSFWLQGNNYIGDKDDLSSSARSSLETLQADDMRDRYGERMGKRLFDTCFLAAYGADQELLGVVAIEMGLFKKQDIALIDNVESEKMLKRELTTLGPKQRRLYKDYTTPELVPELLQGMDAIALLCNLAVSPLARRSGIGSKLCKEVEQYVKKSWNFDNVYLKVEKENSPARKLYEGNLGYELVGEDEEAIALRLNVDDASFEEALAATLILKKSI